ISRCASGTEASSRSATVVMLSASLYVGTITRTRPTPLSLLIWVRPPLPFSGISRPEYPLQRSTNARPGAPTAACIQTPAPARQGRRGRGPQDLAACDRLQRVAIDTAHVTEGSHTTLSWLTLPTRGTDSDILRVNHSSRSGAIYNG